MVTTNALLVLLRSYCLGSDKVTSHSKKILYLPPSLPSSRKPERGTKTQSVEREGKSFPKTVSDDSLPCIIQTWENVAQYIVALCHVFKAIENA